VYGIRREGQYNKDIDKRRKKIPQKGSEIDPDQHQSTGPGKAMARKPPYLTWR